MVAQIVHVSREKLKGTNIRFKGFGWLKGNVVILVKPEKPNQFFCTNNLVNGMGDFILLFLF